MLPLSVMPYVVIWNLTKCHNWISWLNVINPIPWFELISSIIWFGLIISIIWSNLMNSYFLNQFNNFDLNCYLIHLIVGGVKRRSQSHCREHDWLCTDIMQNIREWYIPIFLVGLVMLTPTGHNHYIFIYYWLTLAWRLL